MWKVGGVTVCLTPAWAVPGGFDYTGGSPRGPPVSLAVEPAVPELGVVEAGIPEYDDCPVLTRTSAFMADQGVPTTLQHVFRDARGNPVDLSAYFGAGGDSISNPDDWTGKVVVRVQEAAVAGDTCAQLWEQAGQPHAPAAGVLRVALDPRITERSGIYRVAWGVKDTTTGRLVAVNNSLMSVNRGLFGDTESVVRGVGCLSLQDVRMALRDSAAAENVRLADVEFSDAEVVNAILRPIMFWNETQPPLHTAANTRDFPFREHWLRGTCALLLTTASDWYMRNKQLVVAGGVSNDDFNRNQEYLQRGGMLWKEYADWVQNKKAEINYQLAAGVVASPYGRMG